MRRHLDWRWVEAQASLTERDAGDGAHVALEVRLARTGGAKVALSAVPLTEMGGADVLPETDQAFALS
jgi:hypothetical protein